MESYAKGARATGRRWTWAAPNRDVDDVARGLIAAGIHQRDRVGIWAPNRAEWCLVQYATAKIGANPELRRRCCKEHAGAAGVQVFRAFDTSRRQRVCDNGRAQRWRLQTSGRQSARTGIDTCDN